jgi:GT2 family glycosyltransferase
MHGLPVYQMGCTERMVVHWARNDLAKIAQSKVNEYTGQQFTHILWLDDDHVFNPDMLVYLARHNVEMVSALYFGRAGTHLPVAYVKDKSDDPYKHYPLIEPPQTLAEVDAVGFGSLLMRREVLDAFEHPWFDFKNAGEDITFCVHAKRAGVRVWLDGSYVLGHIGDPSIVTEKTYQQYMRANEEKYADKIKVGLGGKDYG